MILFFFFLMKHSHQEDNKLPAKPHSYNAVSEICSQAGWLLRLPWPSTLSHPLHWAQPPKIIYTTPQIWLYWEQYELKSFAFLYCGIIFILWTLFSRCFAFSHLCKLSLIDSMKEQENNYKIHIEIHY